MRLFASLAMCFQSRSRVMTLTIGVVVRAVRQRFRAAVILHAHQFLDGELAEPFVSGFVRRWCWRLAVFAVLANRAL